MNGEEILKENMKTAKVTHEDLLCKLREANVTQFSQVKAVIMETTGDISVLHHQDASHKIDDGLIKDVRFWWLYFMLEFIRKKPKALIWKLILC